MDDRGTPEPDPFDLALLEYYSPSQDLRRYEALVRLGADAGDALAQYAMATWYLHGESSLGVKPDIRKAVRYLTRAATTLNRAMYDLAVCKREGAGTRRDAAGAYRLMARAASLGCLPAMEEQARCLREGDGVRANAKLAGRIERRLRSLTRRLRKLQRKPASPPSRQRRARARPRRRA